MSLALYILAGLLSAGLCLKIGIEFGAQRIADRIFAASDVVIKRHRKEKATTYSKAYQELFQEMQHAMDKAARK